MKKFIVFAVVLALLVPSLAMAATEFSLGGFIKLDAFWDSSQMNKNLTGSGSRQSRQRQPWAAEVYGPGVPVQLHHQGPEALGGRRQRLH